MLDMQVGRSVDVSAVNPTAVARQSSPKTRAHLPPIFLFIHYPTNNSAPLTPNPKSKISALESWLVHTILL